MSTKLVITNPVFTLGGTDYSDEVAEIRIPMTREALKSTVSDSSHAGWRLVEAGERSVTVDLRLIAESAYSTSIRKEINDAYLAAQGSGNEKLAFTVKEQNATEGGDNPMFTGSVLITDGLFGGQVNQLAEYTVSFPVDGTISVDVTP